MPRPQAVARPGPGPWRAAAAPAPRSRPAGRGCSRPAPRARPPLSSSPKIGSDRRDPTVGLITIRAGSPARGRARRGRRTTRSGPRASAAPRPASGGRAPGRYASRAGVSTRPLPSGLATATFPARTAWTRPGTPRNESRRSSSGSQIVVVQPAEDHVDRLEAAEQLEEDAVVADRQVAPLDQRVAEVAGQVGVLEVGLVVGPGRQEHDPRDCRDRAGRSPAGSRAGCGRTGPAAAPGSRGRPRAASARARCGSPARSRPRRGPGSGPPARRSSRRAHARGRPRRGAGSGRRAASGRGRAGGSRDGRRPAPAAGSRRSSVCGP